MLTEGLVHAGLCARYRGQGGKLHKVDRYTTGHQLMEEVDRSKCSCKTEMSAKDERALWKKVMGVTHIG